MPFSHSWQKFKQCGQIVHKPSRLVQWFTLLTYLLTPWSRVLLEKLAGFRPVKKFPAFYGTHRFITVVTSARPLSLSWANSIQSITPHTTSWRSILILSSHLCLGLPSGLLPSGFPTKTLYKPLPHPICATCHAHLIHWFTMFFIYENEVTMLA